MRKTFKFKLYTHKRERKLRRQINIAGLIYNHCIALHKRYYGIYGKHLNQYQLMKHLTRLKKMPCHTHWKEVPSQAIQDIVQRIEKGYQQFFKLIKTNRKTSPPGFKKVKKYSSITLKQAGWKLLAGNKILIGKGIFKYAKSRELPVEIKTITIKRDKCGDLWLCFSCGVEINPTTTTTGKIAGCDFGLKTFLTLSSKQGAISSPQFFKTDMKQIKTANRSLAGKKKGSRNFYKAKSHLARVYRRVSDKRHDWQWKTARQLVEQYDRLYFEDLNLDGMKRLWGRKISDLALDSFLQKTTYLASCENKSIGFIDRFYPSSKTCSICQMVNKNLKLRERSWKCENCNTFHDRDQNAANNIESMGERAFSPDLGDVRRSCVSANSV